MGPLAAKGPGGLLQPATPQRARPTAPPTRPGAVRYAPHAAGGGGVFKNEWKGWLFIVLAPTLLGVLAVAVWVLGFV